MSEVRITCINKDNGNHENPHEAITHFGWYNHANGKRGRSSRTDMVSYVEGGNRAFVDNGQKAYCIVKTSRNGNKYLQTVADGRESNNLLELSEC